MFFRLALVGFALSLFASPVFAKKSTITCKTKETIKIKEGRRTKIKTEVVTLRFGVSDIGTDSQSLAEVKGSDDEGIIVVLPEKLADGSSPALDTLNAQGGALGLIKGRKDSVRGISLFGDDDGVNYSEVVLYKNSGYTKGYAKVWGDGYPDTYQKITCTVE